VPAQNIAPDPATEAHLRERPRSIAPVFVVGSPRSGTTYLYHILLSAGNFAIYRAESEVFHMLEPSFGDLSILENRKRLLDAWFNSRLFTATGLERQPLEEKIIQACRNGGDFLRIVMEETARHQGVERWAECTPDHVLYLQRIKKTVPDALVVHIIRDGRDVALSMEKQGWPKQLPWDKSQRRMAAGIYWEWMVRRGRRDGQLLGSDYMEVRYEDLVSSARMVLENLSRFIGQDLDYDEIQKNAVGSVSNPNTSFQNASDFAPMGRWKTLYTPDQLAAFEKLLGPSLQEFGYERSGPATPSLMSTLFRQQYLTFFQGKQILRASTPLGRSFVTRDLSKM
jgi:hypothetical protein